MAPIVLVKRLKRKFPVDVVKAVVLFGVQKLGYDQPTVDQTSVLRAFLLGEDVFASLPTGSEKSLASLGRQPSVSTAIFFSSIIACIV